MIRVVKVGAADGCTCETCRLRQQLERLQEENLALRQRLGLRPTDAIPGVLVPADIRRAVALALRVDESRIAAQDRRPAVAEARQVAMYLCRTLLGLSYPQIGEAFDRDHGTVLHAVRSVTRALQDNALLRAKLERIAAELGVLVSSEEEAVPRTVTVTEQGA
jgi:hypothetical protein